VSTPAAPVTENAINRKSLRIALLLRESQVLDESHWQAYVHATIPKTDRTWWEVLNQPITLTKFRDLLLTDVKDLVPGRGRTAIEESLLQPVMIRASEIVSLLKVNNTDVAPICVTLLQQGIISEEQLRTALEEADRNALNVHEVLVASELLGPENLRKCVERGDSQAARENRLLLAGEILIYNSLITKDNFSRALANHNSTHAPLWRSLQDLRVVSQADLFQALDHMELPAVELITYPVSQELLERFPRDFMRRQSFVPLSVQDSHYEIGTDDPFNLSLADTISLLTGRRVSMLYARQDEVLAKLESLFPRVQPMTVMPPAVALRKQPRTATAAQPSDDNGSSDAAMRVSDTEAVGRPAPEPYVDNLDAVQLISRVIETAIQARATDIHMEPMPDIMRIRFRVDGQLHTVMTAPESMIPFIAARIKVLAQMNVTERRRPQDGHFDLETPEGFYDFRVSTLPSIHGEKIVMRVLDSSRVMTGLAQLGLDDGQLHSVQRLISRPHGLCLVTGPTGSGKTSTLYACLSGVNRDGINIITIEDPVEYQLEGITQVQVDPNIDLSFAAGLRSALRQDPDVIMVGEIRDPDTARTAVRAALTGHLVFSTLHTNTAIGAISAMTNMDIQQYLIASGLSGIMAQRLVRVICPDCKKAFHPQKGVLAELGLAEAGKKRFYRGTGCDNCFGTGYMGRTGIFQVVEVNEALRRAIGEHDTEAHLTEEVDKHSQTLMGSGVKKILSGVTTPAEVLKAVSLHG
jgi:type II secretory ATPase GspE/PulE/Tfp pilus assembly ATPase PilB-like protein